MCLLQGFPSYLKGQGGLTSRSPYGCNSDHGFLEIFIFLNSVGCVQHSLGRQY